MELQGKVALVTGAGSGIGKATALRLAREGASVGVLSRTDEEIQATVQEIEQAGGQALPLLADISHADQMKDAVDWLVRKYGRLDIVFANAGINGVWAPIDELQPEEWDETIAINLRGTYLTIHYSVPHLKKAGGRVDRHHLIDQWYPHFHKPRGDSLLLHEGSTGRDGPNVGYRARQVPHPSKCRLSR